jgi:tetratricopeptide (TPR) repeat protein
MVTDFYAMLGVDPGADRSTIDQALERCQPLWSAGTRNPKTKHRCQSYLDQIPVLRRSLLGDPKARAAYDQSLRASAESRRVRQLEELARRVRLRAAKGGLTVTDREVLRREAERLDLGPDDLARQLQGLPPLPEPPPNDSDPAEAHPDVLDPGMRRQIRHTLDHLGRHDLYALLDLPRDAPVAEIVRRADEQRRRWMQKTQVTADKTAWLEAIALAQSHLAQARERYDRTLALEAEEEFRGEVDFAIESLAQLDPATQALLELEAARLGVLPARARALIRRACRERAVALIATGSSGIGLLPDRLLRCRRCGGLTRMARESEAPPPPCRFCKRPLLWNCPSCAQTCDPEQAQCSCGFSSENLEPFNQAIVDAKQAYQLHDLEASLRHLDRAKRLAPRSQLPYKAEARIKQRLAEAATVRGAFEVEWNRDRMVAARKAALAWSRLVGPADPACREVLDAVHSRLAEAAALSTQARRIAGRQPEEARLLYLQALEMASDFPEAREGLEQCPPGAPLDLEAEVADGAVRLSWSAPPDAHLAPLVYLVVRKLGAPPRSPGDGTTLAQVDDPSFTDGDPPAGQVLGYAVYSRRNRIDSMDAARLEVDAQAEPDPPAGEPSITTPADSVA